MSWTPRRRLRVMHDIHVSWIDLENNGMKQRVIKKTRIHEAVFVLQRCYTLLPTYTNTNGVGMSRMEQDGCPSRPSPLNWKGFARIISVKMLPGKSIRNVHRCGTEICCIYCVAAQQISITALRHRAEPCRSISNYITTVLSALIGLPMLSVICIDLVLHASSLPLHANDTRASVAAHKGPGECVIIALRRWGEHLFEITYAASTAVCWCWHWLASRNRTAGCPETCMGLLSLIW